MTAVVVVAIITAVMPSSGKSSPGIVCVVISPL